MTLLPLPSSLRDDPRAGIRPNRVARPGRDRMRRRWDRFPRLGDRPENSDLFSPAADIRSAAGSNPAS